MPLSPVCTLSTVCMHVMQAGGSHLPDITVITPVFIGEDKAPAFFVASRGHHSDIGGNMGGAYRLYFLNSRYTLLKLLWYESVPIFVCVCVSVCVIFLSMSSYGAHVYRYFPGFHASIFEIPL